MSFQQDSEEYGGGFIIDDNKVRGQQQSCTIKARKEDGQLSNVQLSVRVADDNTIVRFFPGMDDALSIKYSRCSRNK